MQTITLHAQDFYAWTLQQAELMRSHQLDIDPKTPLDARQLPQTCPFSEAEIFEEPVELEL
jgi:hypothetical protein